LVYEGGADEVDTPDGFGIGPASFGNGGAGTSIDGGVGGGVSMIGAGGILLYTGACGGADKMGKVIP
jgi:hypothetical protein